MRNLLILLGLLGCLTGPATAQTSRCADCHFANPDSPAPDHLDAWDRSQHARSSIGCDSCHGGNPNTFESFQAHQGILNSRNPASPVNRVNLPRTCGRCHAGPFVAFQKSRHYELLRGGDTLAPTCVVCHGDVAATLLSPKGLERQCAQCHGPDEVAPHSDYAPEARLMLQGIDDVRVSLAAAKQLIERIDDETRRTNFEDAYQQAEVPVIEAAQSGHAFVFDALEERLSVARERVAALLAALVNPQEP